jgi:death-on-curing family protein
MSTPKEPYEKLKRIGTRELKRVHEMCTQYGKTFDRGVRDQATLEMIAFTIQSHAQKESPMESIVSTVIHDMVKNHPFWDGNHRTAFETARLILVMFGYRLSVTPKEAERFMRNIDSENLTQDAIEIWLKDNLKELR